VHHGLNVIFVVVNNSMYGTIRMHQEREYPGKVYGTSLTNPDFVQYARAFAAHAERVDTTEQFGPALRRSLDVGKPALIEIRLDPEAISTMTTLSAIRQAAQRQTSEVRSE
jgi:acetolactate synthase I/II/III large subunit